MDELIDLLKPSGTTELVALCVVGLVALGLLGLLAYAATKLRSVSAGQGRIEAQFSNNGGSTLKDSVDRLEAKLDAHTADSEGVHADIYARLDGPAG